MKPTNTSKNTAMGYSAAYPTMRRRSSASEGSIAKGEPEGTARGRARSVVFFKVSSFWFLVSGFWFRVSGWLVGIEAAKNAKVAKRFGFRRGYENIADNRKYDSGVFDRMPCGTCRR